MAYAFNQCASGGCLSQSKISATGEAAELLSEVGGTEKGAEILAALETNEEISRVRIRINERLAGPGSTSIMRDPRPGLFRRLFGGWRQTYSINIELNPSAPNGHFIDIDGNAFMPSPARVLGHELGHADIFSRGGGYVAFSRDQQGAIRIENTIARQLDPSAPLRHPTLGHGHPIRDMRWP